MAGRQITAAYKSPQDVEFAVVGGSVSILQARPITAVAETLSWSFPQTGDWELDPHFSVPVSYLGQTGVPYWCLGLKKGMVELPGTIFNRIDVAAVNGFLCVPLLCLG